MKIKGKISKEGKTKKYEKDLDMLISLVNGGEENGAFDHFKKYMANGMGQTGLNGNGDEVQEKMKNIVEDMLYELEAEEIEEPRLKKLGAKD